MSVQKDIDGEKLLNEIVQIRNLPRRRTRKRRDETFNDYFIRISNYTCFYCKRKYPKKDLCVVQKKINEDGPKKEDNRVCACRHHADLKGSMNHIDFLKHLDIIKKDQRSEIVKDYKTIAPRVFAKYNHTCIYCKFLYAGTNKPIPKRRLTLDHKIPISRGGINDEKNLAPACYPCNREKGTLTADEYFEELRKKKEKYLQKELKKRAFR